MSCVEQVLLVVPSITTIIIILTLVVYYRQLRTMHSVMIHQVIKDILMEYRSAEMLLAIRTLWSFYREHPKDFVPKYEEIQNTDHAAIDMLPGDQRLQAERSTLHYFRRLVSHYYRYLGGLYTLKIIPKGILYTYWSESDLRIIPEILFPIERMLGKKYNIPIDNNPRYVNMQKLYDDSRL